MPEQDFQEPEAALQVAVKRVGILLAQEDRDYLGACRSHLCIICL